MSRTIVRIAIAVSAAAALAAPSAVLASGGSGHDDGRHHDRAEVTGQVVSFDGTTLVVHRSNGRNVSGTVDATTELRCLPAPKTATTARHGGDNDGTDDRGHERGDDNGTDDRGHERGDDHGDDANHDRGDDHGRHGRHGRHHRHGNRSRRAVACPTSSLKAGAVVQHGERSAAHWTELTLKG